MLWSLREEHDSFFPLFFYSKSQEHCKSFWNFHSYFTFVRVLFFFHAGSCKNRSIGQYSSAVLPYQKQLCKRRRKDGGEICMVKKAGQGSWSWVVGNNCGRWTTGSSLVLAYSKRGWGGEILHCSSNACMYKPSINYGTHVWCQTPWENLTKSVASWRQPGGWKNGCGLP